MSQDLSVDFTLTTLLHTLHFLKRKEVLRDRDVLRTSAGRWAAAAAADGASGGGERWSRRESIEIRTDEASVQRHET